MQDGNKQIRTISIRRLIDQGAIPMLIVNWFMHTNLHDLSISLNAYYNETQNQCWEARGITRYPAKTAELNEEPYPRLEAISHCPNAIFRANHNVPIK